MHHRCRQQGVAPAGRSEAELPRITVQNQAEYGILTWDDGVRDFKLGDRVELYPTNLDMSANVYDRFYGIVDVWPIMGGSAPRSDSA